MIPYNPIIQPISFSEGYSIDVLRLDLVHPEVSGNKWFKLKYNLSAAHSANSNTVLTFGGPHSNHLAATAVACKMVGLNSIGIVRGEPDSGLTETLLKAQENGMQLKFVSRKEYQQKASGLFLDELQRSFGPFYVIPEGGHNLSGLRGCEEIVQRGWQYGYVFCACGTGTTFAGIRNANRDKVVVGINVLKGDNSLAGAADALLMETGEKNLSTGGNEALDNTYIESSCITDRYAFNGYAGLHLPLIAFKEEFEQTQGIQLDHVYTVKLFYALDDLIKKRKFPPGARILAVHTGGLQGNPGFEKRFGL